MARVGKKSKYLGENFGKWAVVSVGVSYTNRGHNNYNYTLSRRTSDNAANKFITVNSSQMVKIQRGILTPEEILDQREVNNRKETRYNKYVSYHFSDAV